MASDEREDSRRYHGDDFERGDEDENEGPVREPAPVVLIAGCGVVALLVLMSFVSIVLRSIGFFVMGLPGVITMYFSTVCCCLIIAFLAVPVVGGIVTAAKLRTKLLAGAAAVAVTAALALIFIVNPILDIPYLGSPSVIKLEDVSFTSDSVNDSVFYEIEGYDAEGNLRTFNVDRGFGDAWNPSDRDALVTYLPHSETVLSIA